MVYWIRSDFVFVGWFGDLSLMSVNESVCPKITDFSFSESWKEKSQIWRNLFAKIYERISIHGINTIYFAKFGTYKSFQG